MDEFLKDLADLLKKHNAIIIRSANSTHDLVVEVRPDSGYQEVTFEEDISEEALEYEWYE